VVFESKTMDMTRCVRVVWPLPFRLPANNIEGAKAKMVPEVPYWGRKCLPDHVLLHKVEVIGIGEFSLKVGHRCVTVVTDLRTGRVLHADKGRGSEDIRCFLESLAGRRKKRQAMAMEMSGTYLTLRETLPHGEVVFDRFHVISAHQSSRS
jgi:transposase